MLLFCLPLGLSALTVDKMSVLEVPVRPNTPDEIVIPPPYSTVLFADNKGFHGVVGTGDIHVRQFGIVNESYDAMGAYFGPNQGKVRLYGRSQTTVTIYALVPPIDCALFGSRPLRRITSRLVLAARTGLSGRAPRRASGTFTPARRSSMLCDVIRRSIRLRISTVRGHQPFVRRSALRRLTSPSHFLCTNGGER
jgi:hypothetical protein